MSAQISFNPFITTNGLGSFNVQSDGYVQGQAMDDPSARYRMRGGVLASTETIPMWGGVAISETTSPVANGSPNGVFGGNITRATQIAAGAGQLTGFSVFDQNYSAVTSPQSPVPLIGSGGTVNFYPLNSRSRIAVAIDPALVDLEGNVITQNVSWDFSLQRLIPYVAAYNAIAITSLTWSAGVVTVVTAAAHPFAVGDDFTISGAVPAGYNGTFTVITAADNTHLTYALASNPGAETTPGQINAGGGAVPCTILNVQIGNSMVVSYDSTTGFATWNRTGSAALIQI